MDEKKYFDLESVYDSEIAPLMTKIIEICKTHEMPMLATFLYQDTEEEGPGVCTTFQYFDSRETPKKMEEAAEVLAPKRRDPTLMITVTKADGSKEITAVMG